MGKKQNKQKTLLEQVRRFYELVQKSGECVGANVMNYNYRINWITWSVLGCIIAAYISTAYTIYVGVVLQKDWGVMLQALCYLGPGIQGLVKLLGALAHQVKFRFLCAEIDNIYATYENKSKSFNDCLERSLSLIKKVLWLLLIMYLMCCVGVISIPLYYRFFLNKKIFIMQFYIPGIDAATYWGTKIHHFVHIISIIFSCFGNFTNDCLLFISVAHVPLLRNILKCKFDELDEILKKYPAGVSASSGAKLKDIFGWHQRFLKFVVTTKDGFFLVIFVEIVTSVSSIICTIVCHFLDVMPSAPVYLLYSYCLMYAYCALGNLVDVANDDITIMIYDCNWYRLSVADQKLLLIMLRSSQKSEGLSIGGIRPLSLNTGLQLSKTIYTVAMILNEFF